MQEAREASPCNAKQRRSCIDLCFQIFYFVLFCFVCRNDKLKIHMRKHTGERPYSCPHCPARFLHSYDLKNHLHLHTGARPYECCLCHKAFAKDDHLQRHLKGQNCLEVRTRRRRRGPEPDPDAPPRAGTPPAPADLELANGQPAGLRLALPRHYWDQGHGRRTLSPGPKGEEEEEEEEDGGGGGGGEEEEEEGVQKDEPLALEMA